MSKASDYWKKEENIPENSKTIDMVSGTVFSWLPLVEVEELYELGRTAPNDRTDWFFASKKKIRNTAFKALSVN